MLFNIIVGVSCLAVSFALNTYGFVLLTDYTSMVDYIPLDCVDSLPQALGFI